MVPAVVADRVSRAAQLLGRPRERVTVPRDPRSACYFAARMYSISALRSSGLFIPA